MNSHPRISFLILCTLAVCALIPALFYRGVWPVCIIFNLAFAGLAVYANLRVDCAWFGPVLTSFRSVSKQVWLTIDDGPDPQYTPKTLQLLRRFNARATFFLIGDRVSARPDLARSIIAHGHTIGNHSATHSFRSFWAAGPKTAAREIDGGIAAIKQAIGAVPTWFRAPVGIANCFVRAALRERNLALIGWSARGLDGVPADVDEVVSRIFSTIRPGAIVLLHEGSSLARPKRNNLPALDVILTRLSQEGYACVIPEPHQLTGDYESKAFRSELLRSAKQREISIGT